MTQMMKRRIHPVGDKFADVRDKIRAVVAEEGPVLVRRVNPRRCASTSIHTRLLQDRRP
jgi:hypothetical protein